MLVDSLNTWLPEIMVRAGFNAKGLLSFLAVLNGGSLFGALAASRLADRCDPKPVVAGCLATGASALVLLTMGFPLAGLLVIVAVVGLDTSGTQTLIDGFVADEAAIARWCAKWIAAGFDAIEALLAADHQRGDFCFGATPTLADVYLVPQVESARRFKVDLKRWPLISAVDASCAQLAAFRDAAPMAQPDAS